MLLKVIGEAYLTNRDLLLPRTSFVTHYFEMYHFVSRTKRSFLNVAVPAPGKPAYMMIVFCKKFKDGYAACPCDNVTLSSFLAYNFAYKRVQSIAINYICIPKETPALPCFRNFSPVSEGIR